MHAFTDRYGPWAVVTGAAAGIGAAYTAELRARGLNVAGVDRFMSGTDRDITIDLSEPTAAAAILEATAGLDVGLLISNAALATVGPFADRDLGSLDVELQVNVRTPLALVQGLLPRLKARGRGGIVLMSSASALRGSALVASYAAAKAWNLILAESLWEELREEGIDVLGVLPGNTRTPGWLASHPQHGIGTTVVMEPDEVAREALDALGAQPSVHPGQTNRDNEVLLQSLGRTEAVKMTGKIMRQTFPSGRAPDPSV